METKASSHRNQCDKCDRPVLTFDRAGVALCGRHATIFVTLGDVAAHDRHERMDGEDSGVLPENGEDARSVRVGLYRIQENESHPPTL